MKLKDFDRVRNLEVQLSSAQDDLSYLTLRGSAGVRVRLQSDPLRIVDIHLDAEEAEAILDHMCDHVLTPRIEKIEAELRELGVDLT